MGNRRKFIGNKTNTLAVVALFLCALVVTFGCSKEGLANQIARREQLVIQEDFRRYSNHSCIRHARRPDGGGASGRSR